MKNIKDIVEQVKNHEPNKRPSKTNRTVYVLEPQFSEFIRYCQYKGVKHSEVIDMLITTFMQEAQDDLPFDPQTIGLKKAE